MHNPDATLARQTVAPPPATAPLFAHGMVITELREHGDREIPWLLVIRAQKRT